MDLDGCHALITGASAGIGREFACQLAGRAASLLLVARREARLEELRAELKRRNPKLRVEIHPTDLSQPAAVAELLAWINSQEIEIDLLINNAGVGDLGSFATADPARIEDMLEVNIAALTQMSRGLLPAMIKRGRGGILNVSSCAGFVPIPNFAVYAASKAYVTSFSEALRSELHDSGVHVTALCPGPVPTEFNQIALRQPATAKVAAPAFTQVPVTTVVADALEGMERNRPIVIPGLVMKLAMFIVRLTPRSILRLTSRLFAKPSE
jgi:short-subunit dehydrogenase